ncbi:MAG: hypothetical protein QOF98_3650, partial [Streptomyces sp.]|nr:hypothetical protein [Streptomyces sp.]
WGGRRFFMPLSMLFFVLFFSPR